MKLYYPYVCFSYYLNPKSKCGSPSNKLCNISNELGFIIHTVMYLVNSLRLQTVTKPVTLLFLTKSLCVRQFSKFSKAVNSYNIVFHEVTWYWQKLRKSFTIFVSKMRT